MDSVWVVTYAPREPEGVLTLCICATKERAEKEMNYYLWDKGYHPDYIEVEERKLLQ